MFTNFLIIIFVFIILMFIFIWCKKIYIVEGFTWSQNTIQDFDIYESTYNPNVIFDKKELQKQASEEEVKTLMETGMWPWNENVQKLFMENVQNNPIIKTDPHGAMNRSREIYNQTIMEQMLSWKAKEGQFLLTGVLVPGAKPVESDHAYAVNAGMIQGNRDIVRCDMSGDGDPIMIREHLLGNDGITGVSVVETELVANRDLPGLIPGFAFLREECNPCVSLKKDPDYRCPFTLQTKSNNTNISDIWQYLWFDKK